MEKKSNGTSSGGLGVAAVIQIVFIILKAVGLINWPWVAVFIPTFVVAGFIAVALLSVFIASVVLTVLEKAKK